MMFEAICQAAIMPGKPEKRLVLFFSNALQDTLEGPVVDAWLACEKDEKGFVVPESCRQEIIAMATECRPGTRIFNLKGDDVILGDRGGQANLF